VEAEALLQSEVVEPSAGELPHIHSVGEHAVEHHTSIRDEASWFKSMMEFKIKLPHVPHRKPVKPARRVQVAAAKASSPPPQAVSPPVRIIHKTLYPCDPVYVIQCTTTHTLSYNFVIQCTMTHISSITSFETYT
jgi:hypothetical protein